MVFLYVSQLTIRSVCIYSRYVGHILVCAK